MQVITIDKDNKKRVYNKKEVALLAGVSPQSIILWEKSGNIPLSTRDENGYRYWYEDDLESILRYANTSIKDRHKQK